MVHPPWGSFLICTLIVVGVAGVVVVCVEIAIFVTPSSSTELSPGTVGRHDCDVPGLGLEHIQLGFCQKLCGPVSQPGGLFHQAQRRAPVTEGRMGGGRDRQIVGIVGMLQKGQVEVAQRLRLPAQHRVVAAHQQLDPVIARILLQPLFAVADSELVLLPGLVLPSPQPVDPCKVPGCLVGSQGRKGLFQRGDRLVIASGPKVGQAQVCIRRGQVRAQLGWLFPGP